MPYLYSKKLQVNRFELDEHETSKENLINAETAYLEMCELYNFIKIECIKDDNIRPIEEISGEIYDKVSKML